MCKMAAMKTLTTTILLLAFFAGATQAFAVIQETKFTAFDAASGDNFGYSVSTDGHYAIAGAYRDDHAYSDAGSAYIFERVGNTWTTPAIKLTDSAAREDDEFGISVSIDGSYAIVGAHQDNNIGFYETGSVSIFEHTEMLGWVQQPKLLAGDAAQYDHFGTAVDIRGNYAIVGALDCDVNGEQNAGAAYVFKRETQGWEQKAKLTANTPGLNNQFGNAVAIDGDYAIVGEEDSDNYSYTGAVYIYERSGETWSTPIKLTAEDATAGDFFGHSVSIDGDYAIVGAYWDDIDGIANAGSAYIFHRSGGTWIQQAKLVADDATKDDWFGCSVSISGDYAMVGSHQDDDGGAQSGSAYVFHRTGTTTWTQIRKLTAGDAAGGDNFGRAVSIRGEYGMAGAPYSDGNGTSSGSAYMFHPVPEPCTAAMLLLAAAALLFIRRAR